jgi:hypothetical protein
MIKLFRYIGQELLMENKTERKENVLPTFLVKSQIQRSQWPAYHL